MGKQPLFSLTPTPTPFMAKGLYGSNLARQRKKRTSQEIKLQVVDTFRNAMQVNSVIDDDDEYDSFGSTRRKKPLGSQFINYKGQIGWWEPPMECLPLDFCRDTSLHGLKYIGQSRRHLSERIFWLVAFLTGVCAAIYLISDVWLKYKASPVIVAFEPSETNIDKIPFPAVTICNMNKVLRSKAQEYIRAAQQGTFEHSELRNIFNLEHVCTSSKSFTKRFNFSSSRGVVDSELLQNLSTQINSSDTTQGAIQYFLQEASQQCNEMIPLCIWHDEIVPNCSVLFRPIETDFGKCCTFNMVPQTLLRVYQNDSRDNENETLEWSKWDSVEGVLFPSDESGEKLQYPWRQIRAGKSFGLSILLDPDLDEYFCTTSDSTGFRLSTHLSTETPHVIDFGLGINPKSEVFVDVRPEITTADLSIRNYDLEKRQCYFPGEISLLYYNYYTVANCIDECVANVTFENCTCVRFYMPRSNNQSLCNPEQLQCVDNIKRQLSEAGLKKSCNVCLPTCTEINYAAETTSTPMQEDTSIWETDDPKYASLTSKCAENHTSIMLFSKAKNNVSIVHIFFGTDSTYSRVRKELYGVTDLIANTGGLMGLCLGFSGLSAMEVLYFLSLRAWCRTRRKRTFGARVAQKFRYLWAKIKGERTYGGQPTPENSSVRRRIPGNSILPKVSINDSKAIVFQNRMIDQNLPDYNNVLNEISPFYTNHYWRELEMNNSEL